MTLVDVLPAHPLRAATEALIRRVYAYEYAATPSAFPVRLLAHVDADGQPQCAAGLRFATDGFFSEQYLDLPIEALLGTAAGHAVQRARIFEVTTLASQAPGAAVGFLGHIVDWGQQQGFDWAFFTATDRLRALLRRLGLPLLALAGADPARLTDAGRWGRYYLSGPSVCAVDGARLCAWSGQRSACRG